MAYAKVDESGSCIQGGLIRVRVNMYLEPGDPGYDEHYVSVPDESSAEFKAGYKGAMDAAGRPKDAAAHKAWLDSLPHIRRNNPFVNHFVYVGHETTAAELKALAQSHLDEFIAGRSAGKTPKQTWDSKKRPTPVPRQLTAADQAKAEEKLASFKALGNLTTAKGKA